MNLNILFKIYGVSKDWTVSRMKKIVLLVIRYTFWYLFVELWLHFIYTPALSYKTAILRKMDLWAMSGICISLSFLYMLKHVFIYGITRPFMIIDGIEPPNHPKCIAHIHCPSDMWRYFDQGHHKFFYRYS